MTSPSNPIWRCFVFITILCALATAGGTWIGSLPQIESELPYWHDWWLRCLTVCMCIVVIAALAARWIVNQIKQPIGLGSSSLGVEDISEVSFVNRSLADSWTTSKLPSTTKLSTKDVVNLREWSELLDRQNQQLSIVLEAMVEGVIAIDTQETILLANTAAMRLLDLKPRDVTGRPLWEAVRIPQIQELVKHSLNGGDQLRVEIDVPRTQSVLTAVSSRLPGNPCSGVVIVLHDVTDLRRLESLRREFVSNVSHELKTPLAAISAYAETLLDGAIDDTESNRNFVSRIAEQADRLHVLILELLALARMESEENTFELTLVDIGAVVQASVDEHADVAKSRNICLESISADDTVWCLADLESVRIIVDNLLDNAINYTSPGGRVLVRWRRDEQWGEFDVEDNGIGIAKENQARIFERFFRADKARSREVGGTGLGLSIVKHLCQVLGGNVTLTSQLGKGSRFTIRLRAIEQATAESVNQRLVTESLPANDFSNRNQ